MIKKFLLFFICCSLPLLGFGQYKYDPPKPDTTDPIGTVKINDSLFIDRTPVTNLMYLEFIGTIERFYNEKSTDSLKQLPKFGVKAFKLDRFGPFDPDFLVRMSLNNKHQLNGKNLEHYYMHPAHKFHPVLFTTKEQAKTFCKWRTDMVMLLWSVVSKTEEERNQYPQKIKYRLPTEDEYYEAQQFFKNKNSLQIVEDKIPYQPSRLSSNNIEKDLFYILNISEYTADSTPVGNNWRESDDFSKENDYTGFRCICEVEK